MLYLQGFYVYLLSEMREKKEHTPTTKQLLEQMKEKDRMLDKKDEEIFKLRSQLAYLIRQKFGRKSERYTDPDQLSLFQMQELLAKDEIEQTEQIQETTENILPQKSKSKPKRKLLAKELPRKTEVLEPENLADGAKKIGEEITEKLEYTPGELWVRRIVRPKYALKKEQTVVTAPLPTFAIDKGIAGESLLAYLIISKYVDHLPVYRLVSIFKRAKVHIAQGTISGWFIKVANLLEPIYDLLKKQTLSSTYIQADQTTIQVQMPDKPATTHRGYYWVYHAPRKGALFFEYDHSRTASVPQKTLENYQGALQTDGYIGYDNLPHKEKITHLACMAHARRYFENAKDEDPDRARYILAQIQRLYAIERQAAELTPEQRYKIRQSQAVPILEKIKTWLDENRNSLLPKSFMGKAFVYALNRWKQLCEYTNNGDFLIDNNLIENKIRPIALGRKNYLFAGNGEAAERGAIFYTLMAACKINNVNPYLWLKDVLTKIQDTKTSQLENLLPANWTDEIG